MAKQTSCNILFLCTGNSARSILGEALATHLGRRHEGRYRGFSAGSNPTGQVNPFALATLCGHGINTDGFSSKSWDVFESGEGGAASPRIDIVVTVCDAAGAETCPVWPGHPLTVHWGLPDPAAVSGSDCEKREAFEKVYGVLETRLTRLIDACEDGLAEAEWPGLLSDLAEVY